MPRHASSYETYFVRIRRGSTATIYFNTAVPDVFKKCLSNEDCSTLSREFQQLQIVNVALQASDNTIFAPTALEFFTHDDFEFWTDPDFTFPPDDATITCAYSMTRIYPFSLASKRKLVDLFCPPHLKTHAASRVHKGYHLVRLLLGSPDPETNRDIPERSFSTNNFPLTRGRAEQLGLNVVSLSEEMGCMLARLHMVAKNDAYDIKVVLGADITNTVSNSKGIRAWVIGFDHVKGFNFSEDQVPLLVAGFFATDAYFPRARRTDLLYRSFSDAYLEECNKVGEVAWRLGQNFIMTLEAQQMYTDASALF